MEKGGWGGGDCYVRDGGFFFKRNRGATLRMGGLGVVEDLVGVVLGGEEGG